MWMKVGGTLHGAQLADANHRTRHGSAQTHRVGDNEPNVRGFENQRSAFDHRCVSALAALCEPGLDERQGIGEPRNRLARRAFTAEIVLQPLAIRGLCKHSRQREFSDTAWPREKQRARRAPATQHASKRVDDAFVADELIEAHGVYSACPIARDAWKRRISIAERTSP